MNIHELVIRELKKIDEKNMLGSAPNANDNLKETIIKNISKEFSNSEKIENLLRWYLFDIRCSGTNDETFAKILVDTVAVNYDEPTFEIKKDDFFENLWDYNEESPAFLSLVEAFEQYNVSRAQVTLSTLKNLCK